MAVRMEVKKWNDLVLVLAHDRALAHIHIVVVTVDRGLDRVRIEDTHGVDQGRGRDRDRHAQRRGIRL